MANGNIRNLFKSFLIFVVTSLVLLSLIYLFTNFFLLKLVSDNHILQAKHLLEIAKKSLTHEFKEIIKELEIYSKNKDIINLTSTGKFFIDSIQKNNSVKYSHFTRINKNGEIAYTFPYKKEYIGNNVLYQEHNRKLFKEKKLVISKPFLAIQGYKAIAFAYPVFKGDSFDGALTFLIPFKYFYEEFLKELKPTENSFIIVFNEDGKIVYSPDYFKNFEDIVSVNRFFFVDDTSLVDSSSNFYTVKLTSLNSFELFKKNEKFILIKSFIDIHNTKWYIYLYSPEYEVKQIYNNVFRFQTVFIILIFILILVVSFFYIKYLQERIYEDIEIFKEIFEEKNLTESEKDFYEKIVSSIVKTSGFYLFVIKEDGEIFYSNFKHGLKKNFYEYLLNEKENFLKESIEFIKNKNISKTIFLPVRFGRRDIDLLCNISTFIHSDLRFIILFGFEYDSVKEWRTSEILFMEIFSKWFENDEPICVIEKDGHIVLKNRSFEKIFKHDDIYEIFEDSERNNIDNIIKKVNFDVENITLETLIDGKNFKIIFTPFYNQLLKIDYIYVKFE